MHNLQIIRSSLEHIEDIMVVEKLSFTIPWPRDAFVDEIEKNALAIYFSAVTASGTIGYAGMWKVVDEGHITNIAVHPEFRKTGIGSELLKTLIHEARVLGIIRLTLEVRKTNLPAQAMYKKYGFVEGGIRKAYYADNKEDAIIMWREDSVKY